MPQGDKHGRGPVDARDGVAQRDVDHCRRPVRRSGKMRQAGGLLGGRSVSAVLLPGPARPEARQGRHHDVRLGLPEDLVTQAEFRKHASRVVLDHGVGDRHQPQQQVAPPVSRQIERDAELVAIHRVERLVLLRLVRIDPALAGLPAAEPVEADAGFDLDHVRAQVGEMPGRQRPGPPHREIDDTDAGEQIRTVHRAASASASAA